MSCTTVASRRCANSGSSRLGEEALEHQDAPRVVPLAQVDRRSGSTSASPSASSSAGSTRVKSVPVCVRLDHRQHLGAGRLLAHLREIGAQRGEVDLGVQRAGHAGSAMGVRSAWPIRDRAESSARRPVAAQVIMV